MTRRLIRAFVLLAAGSLGWVMICAGPRLLGKLQVPRDVSSRWMHLGNTALAAAGVFVFAYAAAQCFPMAHRRLTAFCEMAPWIGLGCVLIGGVLE